MIGMTARGVRRLRKLRIWLPAAAVGAALVALNLYAVARPARIDLTSAGVYSIGPETRRVLASVAAPVAITFFYDVRSKNLLDAKALLDQYAAAAPAISVRAVDPVLRPAEARRYNVQFAGTAIFESGARRVVVNGGTEADFTNGLIRVTRAAAQRICFTDGHLESDPFSLKSHDHFEGDMGQAHSHSTGGRALELHERHGMGMARDALETLGYEVTQALLIKGPRQLDGCSVVVVASPQRAFLAEEVAQLRAWLAAGGKAIFMLEPFVNDGLDEVLADFGIAIARDPVHDEDSHYWTDAGTPAVRRYPRHPITRNLALTFFPGAGSLAPVPGRPPAGTKVTPLLQTSARSRSATAAEFAPRILAVQASREVSAEKSDKLAEIVVIGDGDFATNSFFHILGNGALFLNAAGVLAGRHELVDISPRNYEVPRMRLTNWQMQLTFALSTIILPVGMLLLGAFAWWRRR